MMKTLCMLLALIASASAFVVQPQQAARTLKLQASRPNQFVEAFTAASIAIATHPLVALAEEADGDYEYGAVDAPIGKCNYILGVLGRRVNCSAHSLS